jgi:hypothetical protein
MWYANDEYLFKAFERYKKFFFIGFEWEESIRYRVTADWDELVNEDEFKTWCSYFRGLNPDAGTQDPKGGGITLRARLGGLLHRLGIHPRGPGRKR